jgi:hypothetical protein
VYTQTKAASLNTCLTLYCQYTDKKNEIFVIYKEMHLGSVAKSYIRKGFLIYEEMGKYLTKYEEAVSQI